MRNLFVLSAFAALALNAAAPLRAADNTLTPEQKADGWVALFDGKTLDGWTVKSGFATYAELLERYAARTGRDLSGIDYYVAFSCWRLAVISEGVYARYLHGAMGDQEIDLEPLKLGTEGLAERALAAVRRMV